MPIIALYTDFGVADPYVGQLHAVLARAAPGVAVVDLFHSVPDFDIRAGAYLLPALAAAFPPASVFVGVVDPGVGGERRPLIVHADGCSYVGPDNGLFQVLYTRARVRECRTIDWRPARLSASFHGRDLFAPVAARLARGELPESTPTQPTPPPGEWPDDLALIIYIDHYGNAITGMRAAAVDRGRTLVVGGRRLRYAPTFSAVAPGEVFWYENSIGLIEVAAHQARAAEVLHLRHGLPAEIE